MHQGFPHFPRLDDHLDQFLHPPHAAKVGEIRIWIRLNGRLHHPFVASFSSFVVALLGPNPKGCTSSSCKKQQQKSAILIKLSAGVYALSNLSKLPTLCGFNSAGPAILL
jgi:hypothetical protein